MDPKILEEAAKVLMGAPYSATAEQRAASEQVFLDLRKTQSPYAMCKQILETCPNDYVRFEAGVTLKTAVLREWSFLGCDATDDLCLYLLMYISHHKKLERFVKEQLYQVVAVIVKRGICRQDKSKQSRTKLFEIIHNLVASNDSDSKLLACGVLRAILEEFAMSSHSSKLGLRFEDHNACKITLEKEHLHDILLWTLHALQPYADTAVHTLSPDHLSLLASFLGLADQIFQWRFTTISNRYFIPIRNDACISLTFEPPKSWKETIVSAGICEFFFKLQACVSANDDLSHVCLQCLLRLAAVSGPVLPNTQSKADYFERFFSGFLLIANRPKWTGHDAFCAASILSQMVVACSISVFASTPDLTVSYIDAVTHLTCVFLQSATTDDDDDEGGQFKEASSILLSSIVLLMSRATQFHLVNFATAAGTLFECYLKCHLTQPDGYQRPPTENRDGARDIDCDVEDVDRVAYSDELNAAGVLSWQSLKPSMQLLDSLLQSKTAALQSFLSGHQVGCSDSLFEDLHWLVLIATHVLVSDLDTVPSVPMEIKSFGGTPTDQTALALNTEYMQSNTHPSPDVKQVDPVVRLLSSLLRLTMVYTVEHNKVQLLSPELASSILWCLRNVTAAYLCRREKQKNDMSPFLAVFLAENHPASQLLCQRFTDVSIDWFTKWSAEPQVVQDAANLLLKLAYSKSRAAAMIGNQKVWELARQVSRQKDGVLLIPPKAQRSFITALTVLAGHAEPVTVGDQLWQEFLGPVKEKYSSLRQMPDFARAAQNEPIKRELVKVIETLRGVTGAVLCDNVTKISAVTDVFLADLPDVLGVYHNCPEMVEIILELYLDVVSTQLFYLSSEEVAPLYRHCFRVLQAYTKFEIGRGCRHSVDSEHDQYTDLLLLIRLLMQLLSNEWFGSSDSPSVVVEPGQPPVDVSHIILFGLNTLIPLMTVELLKFPNLSSEFFKLVTFVCQFVPERIGQLPSSLYCSLMSAVTMALTEVGSDIAKMAMDALAAMASYYFKMFASQHRHEQPLSDTLKHFLKVIFQLLLADDFDMDLTQVASETFFFLIYCHHDYYMSLANELLLLQTETAIQKRVKEAFENLLPPSDHLVHLQKCVIVSFGERLEKFLFEVKGVLCCR